MSKSIPSDQPLYEQVKNKVFSKNHINSAYRSGALVKEYKRLYLEKHGAKGTPYITFFPDNQEKKASSGEDTGLSRWFLEDWTNQKGEKGYQKKGDIYRPTKKISSKTPKTFTELSKTEIKTAMQQKKLKGRVNKF